MAVSDDFDFKAIVKHLTWGNAFMLLLVLGAWALGVNAVLWVAAQAWNSS